MTDDISPSSPGDADRVWQEFLSQFLGEDAEGVLEELRRRGFDPAELSNATGLPTDPLALNLAIGQVKAMLARSMSTEDRSVMVRDIARQTLMAQGDPSVNSAQQAGVGQAFSMANLWLDSATVYPPVPQAPAAWSRAEWVEETAEAWLAVAQPVGNSLSKALSEVLQNNLPESFGDDDAPAGFPGGVFDGPGLPQIFHRLSDTVFAMQIGQAAGSLAKEVFGSTDLALPLTAKPVTALLPANINDFAEGLETPLAEVTIFLALRESAHARLFNSAPWLRAHLIGIVESYAAGITIDEDSLQRAVGEIDPANPEELQRAISSGIFELPTTSSQQEKLAELETLLALIEGWVDTVSTAAAAPHLPAAGALAEMMRRRRAVAGPAEQTFATLVGLELRPRRLREAAKFWSVLTTELDSTDRDEIWRHPDLLPTAEDLSDPSGYLLRQQAAAQADSEFDEEIAKLLAQEGGETAAE